MISIDTALFLADYLVRSGVQRVYVVPDAEVTTVLNAFRLRGVEVVPVGDPAAGAMLAAAESAVHHGLGVIVGGAGPSAAEIAPAAAQAQLERRALIAMTIEPNGSQPRTSTRRVLDLRAVFASITKGSYRLSAENARELIPLAWRLATTSPRGVVHLRVQSDELTKTAPAARGQTHSPAPPVDREHSGLVQRASEMISNARQVVLVVGPGAIEAQADTAARLLAEQWDAPVLVTPMAKGAVAETHPLFAGVYGGLGDRPLVDLIDRCDLVVGFGVSSADFVHPWQSAVPIIHLTTAGPDPGFPAEVVLTGPLNAVANELPRETAEPARGEALAKAARRAVRDALVQPTLDRLMITPQQVVDELRTLAAPELPIAVETDATGFLAAQAWTVTRPGSFLISNGLGLPGAGLALGAVAAQTHAGGAVWLGTDLALISRPSILTLIQENNINLVLLMIHRGLRVELFHSQQLAGYPQVASEYASANLEALAAAFGLNYSRASMPADVRPALAMALENGGPMLVDIAGDSGYWWRAG